MTPHGSLPFALDTNRQRQPALTPQSQSSDHAPSTSTGQKLGSEKQTASAGRVLTAAGSKSPIPARQRRQPAKQALNHSSLPVLLTPAAQSNEQEPASALTPMGNQSGNLGKSKTVASQTRQRAKPQQKAGQKAVSKTKAASKNLRAKAPAQIPTDSPYSVDGH
jgi:hypothetical protein